MKFSAFTLALLGVASAGGFHGNRGGASYVYGGYNSAVLPYQSAYVTTGPRFYGTSYSSPAFAVVGGGGPQGPPGPPHKHGGHHGGGVGVSAFIQPVAYTVPAPQLRVVQQPVVQKMVQPEYYETENVEERVFRTPISKTITELPDDVKHTRHIVKQHFPMIHESVTKHYTIDDELEQNIIHHYYEPKDRYFGTRAGAKFSAPVSHVNEAGRFEGEDELMEMEMVVKEVPSMKKVVKSRPTVQYQEVVEEVPSYRYVTTKTALAPQIETYTVPAARGYSYDVDELTGSGDLMANALVPEEIQRVIRSDSSRAARLMEMEMVVKEAPSMKKVVKSRPTFQYQEVVEEVPSYRYVTTKTALAPQIETYTVPAARGYSYDVDELTGSGDLMANALVPEEIQRVLRSDSSRAARRLIAHR